MIVLRDVTLRRGTKVVLDGASVTLHAGEKIGLVGRNGAGKSSLFALLLGQLHEDAGELQHPRDWRVAHVAQDMPGGSQPATAFVLDSEPRLVEARAALAAAEAAGAGAAIAQAHTVLADAGAHDAPARAQALQLGLGFAPAQWQQPVAAFSGGWRMRLQLARARMCPSDLLLLDEPTNHLDLATREALALAGFDGTVLLVSHDRALLRCVCDTFWMVAEGRLHAFDGDLDGYQRHLQEVARQRREAVAGRRTDAATATNACPCAVQAAESAPSPQERRRLHAQQRLPERLRPCQREQQALEARMATLQAKQTALHETLTSACDPGVLARAGRRLKAVELAAAEERWLALVETIEALQREAAPPERGSRWNAQPTTPCPRCPTPSARCWMRSFRPNIGRWWRPATSSRRMRSCATILCSASGWRRPWTRWPVWEPSRCQASTMSGACRRRRAPR